MKKMPSFFRSHSLSLLLFVSLSCPLSVFYFPSLFFVCWRITQIVATWHFQLCATFKMHCKVQMAKIKSVQENRKTSHLHQRMWKKRSETPYVTLFIKSEKENMQFSCFRGTWHFLIFQKNLTNLGLALDSARRLFMLLIGPTLIINSFNFPFLFALCCGRMFVFMSYAAWLDFNYPHKHRNDCIRFSGLEMHWNSHMQFHLDEKQRVTLFSIWAIFPSAHGPIRIFK